MGHPRRTQPLRIARSGPSTSSLTSLRPATRDDMPEVLEGSKRRLSNVKQLEKDITSAGILVKLFPVDDSNRTLWIVGSPHANKWTPSKLVDVRKDNAKAKASHAAKAGSVSRPRVIAKVSGGKAGRQKEQRSPAKGRRNVAEQPLQRGRGELYYAWEEQEGEKEDDAGEDDTGEDGTEEGDAGEGIAGEDIEEDLNDSEEEEDLEQEEEAVANDEDEHDTEEQDGDEHNRASEEAQAEEADKGQEEDNECGQTLEKDLTDKNGRDEESEDDESGEEGSDDHARVPEDRQAMRQGVAAENHTEAWAKSLTESTDHEEGKGSIDFGGNERLNGEREATPDESKKRSLETSEPYECSTPKDRPYKRSKTDESEGRHDTAVEDSLEQTVSLTTTTPGPRAPSPTLITASPGSTITIIRQTSVVPGLEDTESAVWLAAQRDGVISSLPLEQQTKMVRTALSLGSKEGIYELRRFVSNARRRGEHKSGSLVSDSNLITSHLDPTTDPVGNALVPQSDCLASLSALYRRLDVLESKGTLFTIAKRANLAAMAWYRQSIVPKGVGGTRARDANLKIFRAIFPHYPTLERPEDNPAASQNWSRLRLWLMEGSTWLDVHRLFGGDGAFLALPPQCIPDSHVSRLPANHFSSLLGLLDVAWRALDDDARRTMNALVRLALAGQPLPGAAVALERSDFGTSAATAGLSPMIAGWSVLDYATEWHEDPAAVHSTEREIKGSGNTPEAVQTTTAGTYRENTSTNAKSSIRKETVSLVDDGLLENADFGERLSQQI